MISKTIGFRGTQHFQTHPHRHTHKCASNVKSMMISDIAPCTFFNCATSGASALYRTRDTGMPTMLRNGFLRFPMYGECPGYLSLIPKSSRSCHLPRTHNPLWLMRVKMCALKKGTSSGNQWIFTSKLFLLVPVSIPNH